MKRAASGGPSANRKPAKTKSLAKFTVSDESEGDQSDGENTRKTQMASSSSSPALPGDLPGADDAAGFPYDMELETEHSKASLGPAGAGGSASTKCGATCKGKGRPARPMGSVAWMQHLSSKFVRGPTSSEELFTWPEDHHQTVLRNKEWTENLMSMLEFGVEASTDYSGVDMIRESCA